MPRCGRSLLADMMAHQSANLRVSFGALPAYVAHGVGVPMYFFPDDSTVHSAYCQKDTTDASSIKAGLGLFILVPRALE